LPIHFDTAVASGVYVRLDIDQQLDCDLKPNPEDFSISLPLCEANANATVRPIAIELKPKEADDNPRTSIILVLDEPLPPISEMELHYHPQEALMWSNTLDDAIGAFITHIPVKLSRHEPKEAFSTKLLETIAQKAKKPEKAPALPPAITNIVGSRIDISLNRILIPHQGVAVGDFRAEAQDRWCTVSAAAIRQLTSEDPHEIQLALKDDLEPGDILTVAFKAKRYPITALDGSQINNFKISARYQGPGEFEILETGENRAPDVKAKADAEQYHLQALETIMDEDLHGEHVVGGTLRGLLNSMLGVFKRSKAKDNTAEEEPGTALTISLTLTQKIILVLFLALVVWLVVVTVRLTSGLSDTAPASVLNTSAVGDENKPCNLSFASGNQYSGTCNAANKPDGRGIFQWKSGSTFEGDFASGQRSGDGYMTYPNGAKYDGQWQDDKKHGQGTYWTENGNRFEGQFEQGKMTENGTCYLADGSEQSGYCPN